MHLPCNWYFKSAIGAFKCIGSGLRCRKLCAEDRYIGEFTAAVEGFRTYCHYIRSDFHCCQLLRSDIAEGQWLLHESSFHQSLLSSGS